MPYAIIANSGLESEAITAVLAALEQARDILGLADTTDALTMILANKLIELAKDGERDLQRLGDLALEAIRSGTTGPK